MSNIEATLAAIDALGPEEPFVYAEIAKRDVLLELRSPEDTKVAASRFR